MKNEFALAFNEVIEDKQLPKEVILEAIEAAMVSAYRRAVNASNAQSIEAKIDPESGEVRIFAEKEVVDVVQDERTEVMLSDAVKIDSEVEIGQIIVVESTPNDFGRVAAQTARQVIQQRIREAERDAQFNYFADQVGEIISGVVQAISNGNVTLGIDMKAEGTLPYKEQIPGERFRIHERVRSLLLDVKQSPRGPQILLSRAHRNFLRRLLENEVPEVYHGMIEIRSIAREPGQRSKVAVAALKPGVDPVGACVGIRGVRIQAIVRELNDEKIDVIEWNPDPTIYIAKSLSPARVSGVYLNELAKGTKTATVVVPEDQLSLAIGRDGQNARLAAKLTGWRIDIKSLPEAASDLLYKLGNDPEYIEFKDKEDAVLPQVTDILTKKSEGRPVTPEEYQVLNQFVDRVERSVLKIRQQERKAKEDIVKQVKDQIPEAAFDIPIEEMEISQRICTLLRENSYETVGDLLLQMEINPDKLLSLQGIGPKAMEDIRAGLDQISAEFEAVAEAAVAAEEEAVQEQIIEEPAEELVEAVEEEIVLAELAITEAVEEIEQPAEAEEIEIMPAELPSEEPVEEIIEEPVQIIETVEAETTEPAAVEEIEELEGEAQTFDQLFEVRPDIFDLDVESEDEDEEFEEGDRKHKGTGKKKKRKKKKFVEMEYDPDKDVVIVKKKRKREDEWDEFNF